MKRLKSTLHRSIVEETGEMKDNSDMVESGRIDNGVLKEKSCLLSWGHYKEHV